MADDDVQALNERVAELEHQLDDREAKAARAVRVRRGLTTFVALLAALGLVVSAVAIWTNRVLLDTDRFVVVASDLADQPAVADALADEVADQIMVVTDFQNRLAEVLPPELSRLAGPLTAATRGIVRDKVREGLDSEQFKTVWTEVNERAHTAIVKVLRGESDVVMINDNQVTIDLLPLINQALVAVEGQLSDTLGRDIQLPEVEADALPEEVRARLQTTFDVELPATFGSITIYDTTKLTQLQSAITLFDKLVIVLPLVTTLLLVLALGLSPDRRRTALILCLATSFLLVIINNVVRAATEQVAQEAPRDLTAAITQATDVLTSPLTAALRSIAIPLALVALVLWLIGPGRAPRWLRAKVLGPVAGTGVGQELLGLASRARTGLQVFGVAMAAFLFLVVNTSWLALVVILAMLGAWMLVVSLLPEPALQLPGGDDDSGDGWGSPPTSPPTASGLGGGAGAGAPAST